MSADLFASKARKHWAKWLPTKTAELKASGELESTLQATGKQAQERLLALMQQGYRAHEAEEVAMHEFVLLAPEAGAGLEDWESAELALLEKEHRALR